MKAQPRIHEDWGRQPVVRGEKIEQALGQNLPRTFETIDRFDQGIATSIKSLDLRAKTYQNPSKLSSKLKGYVDKVADFNGGGMRSLIIESHQIKERALHLVIPHAGTLEQQALIDQIIQYEKSKGIVVNNIIH